MIERRHEDEIIGTKEKTDEYAYQWPTVQLVGNAVPLVLDARPVQQGESRKEIVENLLDSAEDLVHVDNVLMYSMYSIWRAVDLLVQVELTGEYEHSPIVTADNTLTLLKKETGIG